MSKNFWFIIIYLSGIFISSIAQIILKKSTKKKYTSVIREYLNVQVIVSYGIFFLATFITIFAYKGINLSVGPILAASEYIFVAFLSWLFLKEKINKKKLMGLSVIIIGIIIYSL